MAKNKLSSKKLTEKELIITLIKAEMHNQRFKLGLAQTGATVEDFDTDLGTTILKLIGFEDTDDDELFEVYYSTMQELIDIELDKFLGKVHILTLEMYNELLKEKMNRQR